MKRKKMAQNAPSACESASLWARELEVCLFQGTRVLDRDIGSSGVSAISVNIRGVRGRRIRTLLGGGGGEVKCWVMVGAWKGGMRHRLVIFLDFACDSCGLSCSSLLYYVP